MVQLCCSDHQGDVVVKRHGVRMPKSTVASGMLETWQGKVKEVKVTEGKPAKIRAARQDKWKRATATMIAPQGSWGTPVPRAPCVCALVKVLLLFRYLSHLHPWISSHSDQ